MTSLIESELIERTVIEITQEQAREIGTALRALMNISFAISKDNNVKQLLSFEIGD